MTLLKLHETPSEKASVQEVANFFENAEAPMTMDDALEHLRVYDPARQRSLSAAFIRECVTGRKYAHLVGVKIRPSTKARGRSSIVFQGVPPLAPKSSLTKRSDAFAGIRAIDTSSYSEELTVHVEKVTALNLTGKTGSAVNRLAVEYDHALELERVKRENAMTLADERLKMVERVMEVLNRVTDGTGGESNGRRVRPRPEQEAAE